MSLEPLEERLVMAIQPLTLTDPGLWGQSAYGASRNASMSADGQRIVFESDAENLVPNDTNGVSDVFLYERGTGRVSLLSVNSAGTGSGGARSIEPVISADGRHVVFRSDANDLVAGVNTQINGNGSFDLFVRDLVRGQTFVVSTNLAGTTGGNGNSDQAVIVPTAASGAMIAFRSSANTLVAGDTNGSNDLFVRQVNADGTLGATQRISVATGGTQGDGHSFNPRLSANGRFVVFMSNADNLAANDDNTRQDVFLRDLQTNTTELISVDTTGLHSANGRVEITNQPISADGTKVVFHGNATNLAAEPNGNTYQVYVRDRVTQQTRMVSVNAAGTAGTKGYDAGISANGRFVGFTSQTNSVDPTTPDTNNLPDVYLRDLHNNTTRLASVNAAGTAAGNNPSGSDVTPAANTSLIGPALSDDGRFIAFNSRASNLSATPDLNGVEELYVRDRQSGTTRPAALNAERTAAGNATAGGAALATVSTDFQFFAFASNAADLVAADNNGVQDVFIAHLNAGLTELVSRRSPLLPAERLASKGGDVAAVTPDGRYVAFISTDTAEYDRAITILSGHNNLFVRDTVTGQVRVATVLPNGTQTGAGAVGIASFSADGRFLAFAAGKTNLDGTVAGVGIFLRDLHTGVTRLISRNTTSGAVGNSFDSNSVVTSPNGRWVAFTNNSTNLIDGVTVTFNQSNLYVYDRENNVLRLISINSNGTASGNGSTDKSEYQPVFSADSSRLVYVSRSSDLVAGVTDTNTSPDVFSYDLTGANAFQNRLISVSTSPNTAGNGGSGTGRGSSAPSVSADGRYVAFASKSTDLTAEDTIGRRQVFVRDLVNGTTRLVSFNQANTAGGIGDSDLPQISADGTRVLFQSGATNISPAASNGQRHLYVRYLSNNTTQLVSADAGGRPATRPPERRLPTRPIAPCSAPTAATSPSIAALPTWCRSSSAVEPAPSGTSMSAICRPVSRPWSAPVSPGGPQVTTRRRPTQPRLEFTSATSAG